MYKELILSKLVDYLKKTDLEFKKSGKVVMLECPFCHKKPISANVIPNTSIVNCFACKKRYNLLDIVKELEPDKKDLNEKDLLQYLKEKLEISITTEKDQESLDDILSLYEKLEFDLVPIAANAKNPVEKDWTNKSHKSKEEWKDWILNGGLNIGVKTGKISNITVIDVDQKPIPEEILKTMGKTLIQETNKGFHLFYKYEEDLPKTRIDEYKVDIENDGGQVVIRPSKINNVERKFETNSIIKMPDELKKLLKSKITAPIKTQSEEIIDDIKTEDFKINIFDEGTRNSSLIKLGGIFRKELNLNQTKFVLHTLNNHNHRSGSYREIEAMANQLDRYIKQDENELAYKVLSYLKEAKEASKAEIEICVYGERAKGESRKTIDKLLVYLKKEGKILKRGREYHIVESMEWRDDLLNVGVPLDFKVPYLHDYAYFNQSDIIILGSQNKYGKTTLAVNFIQRLVKQGLKPYYVYNESGCRFAKIALKLGLKDGDFNHVFCSDPEKLILEKRAVTIFDWVKPIDFARTDNLFNEFVEKLQKTEGFLICFVQLKSDNTFFAPNQIGQFPTMLLQYLYEKEADGTHTKFKIVNVRDGKFQGKSIDIPCKYFWDTKEVKRIDEIQEKK